MVWMAHPDGIAVPSWCCRNPAEERAIHMEIRALGIDLAKSVFQLHGVDAAGSVVLRKKLRRAAVLDFLRTLSPCLIGMEACASSHHWARDRGPWP